MTQYRNVICRRWRPLPQDLLAKEEEKIFRGGLHLENYHSHHSRLEVAA